MKAAICQNCRFMCSPGGDGRARCQMGMGTRRHNRVHAFDSCRFYMPHAESEPDILVNARGRLMRAVKEGRG